MGHRTYTPGRSKRRGNRRTRSGPGRHNRKKVDLTRPEAAVRICLGCNNPFRSHGPWNRFCNRCHAANHDEHEPVTYRVPREYRDVLFDADDFWGT